MQIAVHIFIYIRFFPFGLLFVNVLVIQMNPQVLHDARRNCKQNRHFDDYKVCVCVCSQHTNIKQNEIYM